MKNNNDFLVMLQRILDEYDLDPSIEYPALRPIFSDAFTWKIGSEEIRAEFENRVDKICSGIAAERKEQYLLLREYCKEHISAFTDFTSFDISPDSKEIVLYKDKARLPLSFKALRDANALHPFAEYRKYDANPFEIDSPYISKNKEMESLFESFEKAVEEQKRKGKHR